MSTVSSVERISELVVDRTAYTQVANGRALQITTELGVNPANEGILPDGTIPYISNCNALWDTGATQTCITEALAKTLKLEPVGMREMRTAGGDVPTKVYHISLKLPNKMYIRQVEAMEVGNIGENIDALIGMDVITMGDFAISMKGSKTVFSFRIPSKETIDFRNDIKQIIPAPKATLLTKKQQRERKRKLEAKKQKKRNQKK